MKSFVSMHCVYVNYIEVYLDRSSSIFNYGIITGDSRNYYSKTFHKITVLFVYTYDCTFSCHFSLIKMYYNFENITIKYFSAVSSMLTREIYK